MSRLGTKDAAWTEEFKKYDTYNRGLITAAAFSRVLEDLGLKYGQKEVEEIMHYCIITEDGYVHYKELLELVAPATPQRGPGGDPNILGGRTPLEDEQ